MRDTRPQTLTSNAPNHDRPSRLRMAYGLPLVLFGAYVIFAALLLAGVWTLIAQDHAREQQRQEAELASLARAFEEHVAHTFGRVDSLLDSVAHMVTDAPTPAPTQGEFQRRARELFDKTPPVSALAVTDPDEHVLLNIRRAGGSASLTSPPVKIAGWLVGPDAPLRVGLPLRIGKQADNLWQLPVERGAASNGQLSAVVSALVSVEFFRQFYRDIRLTPDDSIMLLSLDGRQLVHYPMRDADMGADLSGAPIFGQPSHERSVIFTGRLRLDDEPRIVVFRRLTEYPLIVAVSRPESVSMADFREMRRRLVFGAGLLLTLLFALLWIAYRDMRQRDADRAELRRVNASLEARVGRRTAELEQSNRELLAFSYSVSHDLRTPLRAINGFAHALREDYGAALDTQGRDYLDRIYRASVRMGELIDELLSLANVSRQALSFSEVNLTAIAQDIADDLKLSEPHRVVRFDIQPGMRTEGDEVLLRNALTNLLGNAWKFTRGRNPAFISVSAREEHDRVRYTVGDNGVGFDMNHAKRLFQPFQQLHADQGYGGTGIGLASVRRIIERHGGNIWAESSPDRGARFIFELPKRLAVVRRRRGEPGAGG